MKANKAANICKWSSLSGRVIMSVISGWQADKRFLLATLLDFRCKARNLRSNSNRPFEATVNGKVVLVLKRLPLISHIFKIVLRKASSLI